MRADIPSSEYEVMLFVGAASCAICMFDAEVVRPVSLSPRIIAVGRELWTAYGGESIISASREVSAVGYLNVERLEMLKGLGAKYGLGG